MKLAGGQTYRCMAITASSLYALSAKNLVLLFPVLYVCKIWRLFITNVSI